MTKAALTPELVIHGNGSATVFPFNFPAVAAEHLVLYELTEDGILTEVNPASYTINLMVDESGGNCTMSSAPAIGTTYHLMRETTREQMVSVSRVNSYDPKVVERVWDRLTLISQEVAMMGERSMRTLRPTSPVDLDDGQVAIWSDELDSFAPGPDLAQVAAASQNAAVAAQAAIDAAAAAAQAVAIANGANGYEHYSFSGDGSTTVFTLPFKGDFVPNQLQIDFDGALQSKTTWAIDNTELTFSEAPEDGELVTVISRLALAPEAATAQLMVLNDGRSVQSAVDAFDTSGRVYASKAAAQAAVILPQQIRLMVRQGNVTVSYYRDATGDLTTADGAIWKREEGPISRSMFSSDADFDAAAATLGFEFPTPYMTRFDLPPQSIDIMHIGVVPSGLLGDAANNVGAIQDVIDWMNSKTNGGTLVGSGFDPRYGAPIIGINAPIIPKSKVSFDLESNVYFKAMAAMTAMLEGGVGADAITNATLRMGTWDGNFLADAILRLPEYRRVKLRDFRFYKCDGNYIHLGSAAQSSGNYELDVSSGYIYRNDTLNPFTTQSPVGIYSDPASPSTGDSFFRDLIIIGCKTGVGGTFYNCDFSNVHPWSFPTTDGTMEYAFDIFGGANTLTSCYADYASIAGYRFSGGQKHTLIGCRALKGPLVADNSGTCVQIEAGAKVTAIGSIFRGGSASARWATDFAGDLSDLTAVDTYTTNVTSTVGELKNGVMSGVDEGTYTVTVSDASGNVSPTTVTGRWYRRGKLVRVAINGLLSIVAPGGVVAGDSVRVSLPFANSGNTVNGPVGLQTVNFGASRTHALAYTQNGWDYAHLRSYGSSVTYRAITWADITSGVSSIDQLNIEFESA